MKTLAEAWNWYQAVGVATNRLNHLAKVWDDIPWGQSDAWVKRIEHDGVLGKVEAWELAANTRIVSTELDELAIFVLFSVFEATVRDRLKDQIADEIRGLRHPSLVKAGQDVTDAIEQGSFGKLLEPFKLDVKTKNLVEEVNQVRRWRNWVAHGRRPESRPMAAYDRLSEFLNLLGSIEDLSIPINDGVE
jgi:hypothetical protein